VHKESVVTIVRYYSLYLLGVTEKIQGTFRHYSCSSDREFSRGLHSWLGTK